MSAVHNNQINNWTEYIDIVYHFVSDVYWQDKFQLQLVASKDNLSNICTKTLAKPQEEL